MARTRKPLPPVEPTTAMFDLPTSLPAAIYYRQSTLGQVGNVSTAMQTIDMKADLQRRGWAEENIYLIDLDEGVSGTTKIDEREGMRELFALITKGKIGAVACVDEDRLFRDFTQIQVNIFIEECRKAGVQVITPTMIYAFHHPLYGDFHIEMFRQKCKMAADYLKVVIQQKLGGARERIMREGKWAGQRIATGYMADMRDKHSPTYGQFVPFEPYAEIIRQIFQLFVEMNGSAYKTHKVLKARGIKFPSRDEIQPPPGYGVNYGPERRYPYPDVTAIGYIVTNPIYIGHFTYGENGAILHWNNHEPIVPEKLFYDAFNLTSRIDLLGDPNPNYRGLMTNPRPKLDEQRMANRPLCDGLLWVKLEDKWNRAGVRYKDDKYQYAFDQQNFRPGSLSWRRDAEYIDEAILYFLQKKITMAANNPALWRSYEESEARKQEEAKNYQELLDTLDRNIANQVAKIEALSDISLIGTMEKHYTELRQERDRLVAKRGLTAQSSQSIFFRFQHVLDILRGLELGHLPYEELLGLVRAYISNVYISSHGSRGGMSVRIDWFDETCDEFELQKMGHRDDRWKVAEVETLKQAIAESKPHLVIAAELPIRKWHEIRHQIWLWYKSVEIEGVGTVRRMETFFQYVRRKHGFDARYTRTAFLDNQWIITVGLADGSEYELDQWGELLPAEPSDERLSPTDVSEYDDETAMTPEARIQCSQELSRYLPTSLALATPR